MNPSSPATTECPTVEALTALLDPLADIPCEISEHLEQCPNCTKTLEWLAGSDVWEESQASLQNTQYEHHRHQATIRVVNSICALSGDSSVAQDPLCEHEIEQLAQVLEPASHPELLGRIGRYELEQLIGRGGMGLVFRAYDTELHRIVAIKTLAVHLVPIGAARERFIREGRACASLIHPHIVPIHDVITDGPVPALVMQLVAGPTLEDWIQQNGPMPWRQASELMIQLLDGLSLAHEKGFVHRDIKPGNVLLEVDASRALLTDFGLVRTLDDATLTRSGMLAGTPDYMSPEQARGETVEGSSDLFSIGAMFYHMLAGHPPFRAPDAMAILNRICHEKHRSLSECSQDLPREIVSFVDGLLQKDSLRRLSSASEAREELERISRAPLQVASEREKQHNSLSKLKTWQRCVVLLFGAIAVWALPSFISSWSTPNLTPEVEFGPEAERELSEMTVTPSEMKNPDSATKTSASGDSQFQNSAQETRPSLEPSSGESSQSQMQSQSLSAEQEFVELAQIEDQINGIERQLDNLWRRSQAGPMQPNSGRDELPQVRTQQLRNSLHDLERRIRSSDH
ncbi:MAG: serine/threonine-protein kinase [Planctomycetota bacterium]